MREQLIYLLDELMMNIKDVVEDDSAPYSEKVAHIRKYLGHDDSYPTTEQLEEFLSWFEE